MNLTSPCIPWYFPKNDSSNVRVCNPWEARTFRNKMDAIPNDQCNYCLPDCSKTLYHATVTAAPFRRCNFQNLGISHLCNFESKAIDPPVWGQPVLDQYLEELDGEIPNYIQNGIKSNKRYYAGKRHMPS